MRTARIYRISQKKICEYPYLKKKKKKKNPYHQYDPIQHLPWP
jgi:hypothetical protein